MVRSDDNLRTSEIIGAPVKQVRRSPVAYLVAITYAEEDRASEVIEALKRLEADGGIELDDAVAVTKDKLGGIKLGTVLTHTAGGAAAGAVWGALLGLVFLMPAVGAAFGAVTGALAGKLVGVGRANAFGDFGLHVQQYMPPGSSALLMLIRKQDPERAIAALERYGGHVERTTLPDEIEAQLRQALGQFADEDDAAGPR